jgi:hypothetical protein
MRSFHRWGILAALVLAGIASIAGCGRNTQQQALADAV